jgi:hypothetical protein
MPTKVYHYFCLGWVSFEYNATCSPEEGGLVALVPRLQ